MDILKKILEDKTNRESLVRDFQESVWNDENASEVLRDLAYDLDFYVPNDKERKSEPSYYDDSKLEIIITEAIQKLK